MCVLCSQNSGAADIMEGQAAVVQPQCWSARGQLETRVEEPPTAY